jgi:hypothetical protein
VREIVSPQMLLGPAVSGSKATPSGLNLASLQASKRTSVAPSAKAAPPGRFTSELLNSPWAKRIQPPGARVN